MSAYNFLNYDGTLLPSNACKFDSNIGYEADFSNDGEVDGWELFDGIHTYGCWNHFLFGTLYDTYALIGRYEPIRPVAAENFYTIRIVMKLFLKERGESVVNLPTKGRIMWKTIASPVWDSDKTMDFDLDTGTDWHTYYINMGEAQWWQGDISDLRFYPILEHGVAGDEFYLRVFEILSVDDYKCLNVNCDYHTNYEHNCPGIGERGYAKSQMLSAYTFQGSTFEFADSTYYTIREGINDTLLVSMNGYGFENIVLDPIDYALGSRIANSLAKEIAKLDVGGYAENTVEYSDKGEFIIYNGVYANDSIVEIGDSQLARDLNFYDSKGNKIYTQHTGRYPASGFEAYSSFHIKTSQVYSLLDESVKTEFYFNPFIYNVEGGRQDWLEMGLGKPTTDVRTGETEDSGLQNRYYDVIENAGKTIIDFNHPFNASGRIKKIYAALTLDNVDDANWTARGAYDSGRIDTQLYDAKVMFFRPLKNGDIRVLDMEVPIADRDHDSGKIYSSVQEYVELDCDVFVNKGDLIGVYNANIYKGRAISRGDVDALYYQVDGKASGDLEVRQPLGQGTAGLMIYARSNEIQNRLVLNLDLGKRINVEDFQIYAKSEHELLEYNVARCLDINWELDLFGEDHGTGWIRQRRPLKKAYYNHPNVAFGMNNLTDGIKTAPDGLSADAFSIDIIDNGYISYGACDGKQDGGVGIVPSNPHYFWVNGDMEWLGTYHHVNRDGPFLVGDFNSDPIAFTLRFPLEKEKLLNKFKIYFKEQYNFRSFEVSIFRGEFWLSGDADDIRFELIPENVETKTPWTHITIDGLRYEPDMTSWESLDLYLAKNPVIGHRLVIPTSIAYVDNGMFDGVDVSYYDDMGGQSVYQTYTTTNSPQFEQAKAVDWTILEMAFTPQYGKGFRFYVTNHHSTKICEFEVYCVVENITSPLAGSIEIQHSSYQDYWWPAANTEEDYGVRAYVGDTPRYANIVVKPIAEMRLSDLIVNASIEDVFMGEKGCQHQFIPEEAKRGVDNKATKLEFKNIYGRPYDLYVDIASPELVDEGTVFYSLMNNQESIENPAIGADAFYRKHEDYLLEHYQKNVAINCPVWALKNLVDGCQAWYSYDDEYSWKYYGQVAEGNSFDFPNLPDSTITTLNVPVLTRSTWWKFGFYDPRVTVNVREVQIYYEDEEIFGVQFYHQKDADPYTTRNTDTAPHLKNDIVDGSYYVLNGNNCIGFRLPAAIKFDRLVIYHDRLLDYENSWDKAGIDKCTALCIHGTGETYQTDTIVDESYFEHDVQIIGTGIYCDEEDETLHYDFTEDFSTCISNVKTFDSPPIDTSYWTNIDNATIYSGTLNITNSGINGQIETLDYTDGDFSAVVDVTISGAYDSQGWGCFLEVFNDSGLVARVGKTFYYAWTYQVLLSQQFSTAGWSYIRSEGTDVNTDLRLQLVRAGNVITMWAGEPGVSMYNLGTSTILGYGPVKFRLKSERSPLTPVGSLTIGMFDNFYVDNAASDWSTDLSESSEFACVSGIGPSGFAYWFDIGCRNSSNASGFKQCQVYDNNDYPFDNEYMFTFDFGFRGNTFKTNTGTSTAAAYVSVGILGKHVEWKHHSSEKYRPYFSGVQMVMGRDHVFIVVQDEWTNEAETTTAALDTTAAFYYARLASDGNNNYTLQVWTDDWDGATEVVSLSLDTDIKWTAYKIGVGSGAADQYNTYTYRATGWVSDFDFTCDKTHVNKAISSSSIKFSGVSGEKLLVGYENSPICNINTDNFWFDTKLFTIDFFISFSSLPPNDGDYAVILKCWDDNHPFTAGQPATGSSWALILRRQAGGYLLQLYAVVNSIVVLGLEVVWNPDIYRWHHIYIVKGAGNRLDGYYTVLIRDGHFVASSINLYNISIAKSTEDVVIGENFHGHIEELRISSDYGAGGARIDDYYDYEEYITYEPPTQQYKRYYTWSFYESVDNNFYGKNFDVDTLFNNTRSYHIDNSYWSRYYYTYLALDFGQRHNIDIVRSFPVDTSYQFTRTDNILYSKKDTSNPITAFSLTESERNLDTSFEGATHSYPPNFEKYDTAGAVSYIIDDTFYMSCAGGGADKVAEAKARFYFYEDFDFYIDFELGDVYSQQREWAVMLEIVDLNKPDTIGIRYMRSYSTSGNEMKVQVKDNASSWSTQYVEYLRPDRLTMRVHRSEDNFEFYSKTPSQSASSFVLKYNYPMRNQISSPEMQLSLKLSSSTPNVPAISVWWDNFVVTQATPIFSTANDARWTKIKMLNGDGEDRIVRSAGFYPDITTQLNAVGQYNCTWEELGTAITSYAESENVALGATISGSSYVGLMYPWNANDGIVPEGELQKCWGAYHDDENGMWITIYLSEIKEVYRFKIFHGFADVDFNNLITSYKIQVSTDEETFSTVFTITDNNEMIRIHDLSTPVSAKAIRLWVDDYNAINRFIYTGSESGYQFWSGPCLREIEVYEYYGFTVINSEDTPVIAIDLQAPFFVEGHTLVGIDAENLEIDWDNDASSFAWSNSHLTNPHKVTFRNWGEAPKYEKWAVIKRNTATHYPLVPDLSHPYRDTPDFLKHALIHASINEDGKAPNPVEYPWFWRTNISELNYDYDQQTDTGFISRSLRIDYPASTDTEHVRYIEGDHFGWDDVASWRDGFGFFLYIDDINNLDLEYGYFYLGGYDYTDKAAPIIHKWNLTTFSGILNSGWNNLNLTFMYADEVVYTELDETNDIGRDPRRLYSINWGTMGFVFRGKGNPLSLNFEGFFIERNHFEHGCFPGQRGLYLHAGDMMKVSAGELDFHSSTIEFWIRPDWGWDGRDRYDDFKFRTLFHISNVTNDVFGAAISTNGVNIYYGNLLEDFNLLAIPAPTSSVIDQLIHLAFVFSNDGAGIAADGSTIRLYINNALAGKHFNTWKVNDNKHFNFFLGGQGLLTLKASGFDPTSSAVDGVVSRLKLHNYCKTDFSESLPDYGGDVTRKLLKPDDFIAISKDNVTFHKVGSPDLPFFFGDVAADATIPIWVRVNVPRFGLTGKEKRTAEVLASWDIGV